MNKGVYAALLSTIFIGVSTVVGAQAAKVANPFFMIAYSTLISVVFLWILFLIFRVKTQVMKMIRKQPKYFFGTVVSRPILGSLLLSLGWSMVPAIRAVFLVRLEPFFVLLMSYLILRDKITIRKIYLTILLLIGAYVFLTNGVGTLGGVSYGDLVLIFALIPLSFSYISSGKILKDFSPQTLTLGMNIVGGIALLFIAFLTAPAEALVSSDALLLITSHAVLFNVLGIGLWFVAIKYTEEWSVSSILSLSPIPGAILASFWLGDTLSGIQAVGGLIMIAVTFLIARASRTKQQKM